MNAKITVTVAAILLAGTLVACSGSNSDEPDSGTGTGNINQFGLIEIEDSSPELDIRLRFFASFFGITNPMTLSQLKSTFVDFPDTCTVKVWDTSTFPTPSSNLSFDYGDEIGNVTYLSAGDVITLTSPTGSLGELPKNMDESHINYQLGSIPPLAGPLPAGLVMDIPGDEFPAFANVPIPDLQTLSLTSPISGQALTTDTEFTWEAGSNSNAHVSISANSDIVDNAYTSVDCTATDDGSFSFSAATKAELGSSFSAPSWTVLREERTFLQQDDAILVLNRYSIDY